MSSMTISVPVVPAASLAPVAAAMGAGLAGLGLAAGAYLAARQLKANYDCALSEFDERAKKATAERRAWSAANEGEMSRAASLASLVVASGGADASRKFLQASLEEAVRLSTRSDMGDQNARARELIKRLEEGARVEELGEDAIRVGNEIHRRLAEAAGREGTSPEAAALLESVRVEVGQLQESGEKEAILKQLDKLDALAPSEPRVALQGIENVRDRLTRLAKHQMRLEGEREMRRTIAADIVARLQALVQVPEAPEREQALALLAELGRIFSAPQPPEISALEALQARAQELFEACQARLDNEAKAAYVTDSVADTLMEMGYKVSHVKAESSDGCMVSVTQDTGVLLHVDGSGQLKTEMVAFEASAVHPDGATQDRVCKIVDQVLAGLRERDIEVREKARKTTKSHEQIRRVERPEKAQASRETAKPIERVIG